jgi:ABC-type multidrug transport system fused ATPase/permease subunit
MTAKAPTQVSQPRSNSDPSTFGVWSSTSSVSPCTTGPGIRTTVAILQQIDPSIEEASFSLGAKSETTFRRITLPLILPAFFAGLGVVFIRSMTAISATIFLISIDWTLITVRILEKMTELELGVAAAFFNFGGDHCVCRYRSYQHISPPVPSTGGARHGQHPGGDNVEAVSIRLNRISKKFSHRVKGEISAVCDVSLEVQPGEFLTLLGPSGSGKSTLLHLIGCLDRPTSGYYFIDNQRVDQLSDRKLARIRNAYIGFVFQTFNLINRTTALDNVAVPLVAVPSYP